MWLHWLADSASSSTPDPWVTLVTNCGAAAIALPVIFALWRALSNERSKRDKREKEWSDLMSTVIGPASEVIRDAPTAFERTFRAMTSEATREQELARLREQVAAFQRSAQPPP